MKSRSIISQNIKDLNLPTEYELWRKHILHDPALAQKISLNYFISDLHYLGFLDLVRYGNYLGKIRCIITNANEFAGRIESYRNQNQFKILFQSFLYRLKGLYENL